MYVCLALLSTQSGLHSGSMVYVLLLLIPFAREYSFLIHTNTSLKLDGSIKRKEFL